MVENETTQSKLELVRYLSLASNDSCCRERILPSTDNPVTVEHLHSRTH